MCLSRPRLSSPPILPKALTCWPRCLPPLHLRCHSAPPVYRERHCGSPHKGTWVIRRVGSGNGCGVPSTRPRPSDDTVGAELCIPLQNVLVLYNTCIGSTVAGRLGPSTRLSSLSQPLMMRFREWWTWWGPCPRTLVQASYIFQEWSSSHRLWVGVV